MRYEFEIRNITKQMPRSTYPCASKRVYHVVHVKSGKVVYATSDYSRAVRSMLRREQKCDCRHQLNRGEHHLACKGGAS